MVGIHIEILAPRHDAMCAAIDAMLESLPGLDINWCSVTARFCADAVLRNLTEVDSPALANAAD